MLIRPALRLQGAVTPPGDKSISHRAVLLAAISDGPCRIRGLADGGDVASTVAAVEALGVRVERAPRAAGGAGGGGEIVVHGVGRLGLRQPAGPIDCGNSGTTMRLLAGLLAGTPLDVDLTGDASLSARPMGRIVEPLRAMGADVQALGGGGRTAPLRVRGRARLLPLSHASAAASAQVKSAVLLAGLAADGRTEVRESWDSRDHTETMLDERGVPVADKGVRGPVEALAARDCVVPADPSAAAFFHCGAAALPGSAVTARGLCLSATRTGYLDVLREMGAAVEIDAARGDVTVRAPAGVLGPADLAGGLTVRCLDEVPALAVAMAAAEGRSWVRDAAELRVKESDRLGGVAALVRAAGAGVDAPAGGDALCLIGLAGARFRTFRFVAPLDHRLAMAAAVAALRADAPCEVGPDAAPATSYPAFWSDLEALACR